MKAINVCINNFIKFSCSLMFVLVVLTSTIPSVLAQKYYSVNFSSQANFTWIAPETDPTGPTGVYFPGGPSGMVTLGGVPFDIMTNSSGYQAWNAWTASGGAAGTVAMTAQVGVFGITDIYTLINTYWGGPAGGAYASLVFTGSEGSTYTYKLVSGRDIRGWCCVGSINGTSTVNVFTEATNTIVGGPGFLDMQHIKLPAKFAKQTLSSIELIDKGSSGFQRVILDGIIVENSSIPSIALNVSGVTPKTGSITCKDWTTSQISVIKVTTGMSNWNCSSAGLAINPKDKITISSSISGAAQ